jgi:multidrug resistance efflux pump
MRSLYEGEVNDPWTRDGLVQADLVLVASPLSGVAEEVRVQSSAEVREGELLFRVRAFEGGEVREVRSPAQGWVIESGLHHGSAVKAGEPLFALAVRDSFRVVGYFRETHLPQIREGAPARVTLMAWPHRPLDGVVESVGRGIERSDGELGPQLLPRVTPTFDWIRLAQRFPVRVRLKELPPEVDLRVGFTASVQVLEGEGGAKGEGR